MGQRRIPPDAGYCTSLEISRILRLTLRQLQWWDERGILKPEIHDQHRRWYSADQVETLRKLAELRRAGVSLQMIRRQKFLDLKFTSVEKVRKPILIGDVLVVRG